MVKESEVLKDLKIKLKVLNRLTEDCEVEIVANPGEDVGKLIINRANGWGFCQWVKRDGILCGRRTKNERCSYHKNYGPGAGQRLKKKEKKETDEIADLEDNIAEIIPD